MLRNAIRDISGADRGFNVGADVLTHTADGVSLANVYQEFQEALSAWNTERNLISRVFTFDTTDSFNALAKDPSPGEDFEEASEFGVAQSARPRIDEFRMGFPLKWYDSRTAFTRKFLRDATYEQLTSIHADRIEADNRLLFRKTLSGLTRKATSVDRATNENGVSVYGLWDGLADSTPPRFGGRTFSSGHNHYLVSGGAVIDGGDIATLTSTIQEHGFGLRGTSEQIVVMVNPVEGDVIKSMRRDPDNLAQHPFDFIPSVGAPAYLTDQTIVGQPVQSDYLGLPIIGSYGDAWIFESYWIPQGYVLALSTSGPGSRRNPLAFRQHPQAASQGLRLVSDNTNANFPLQNAYYERGFGVGVRNRSAAAVMQIKASGSYVDPVWP